MIRTQMISITSLTTEKNFREDITKKLEILPKESKDSNSKKVQLHSRKLQ